MKTLDLKKQFPIFKSNPQLAYLDHAATSQKPEEVISAMASYYETSCGSPNRGAHLLSVRSTQLYERGREVVLRHLKASEAFEVIFTKNATEAINLVVYSDLMSRLKPGDEVLVSIDAHHSVIVPIQRAVQMTGAVLKYVYTDADGQLAINDFQEAMTARTVFLAMPWISNALGSIHDVFEIVKLAKAKGIRTLIDGAQVLGHMAIDLETLSPDYFVFSGHKMYGPQGIGALVAKKELLQVLPPFLIGGDTIEYVTEQSTTFASGVRRFEGGTQNVAGVVGLSAAIAFIESIGLEPIKAHEAHLIEKTLQAFEAYDHISVYGTKDPSKRSGLIAFNVKGVHPHDVASLLDVKGVAIRAGHHCAQPLMQHLAIPASCRVSFSVHNTENDVKQLLSALKYVKEVFSDVY